MKKRPIVYMVCIYIVFLIVVLVLKPAWGEWLFRWEEEERKLKQQYENSEMICGLVLWIQERQDGARAKIRLEDDTECMLILTEKEKDMLEAGCYIEVQGELWWPESPTNPGQWDGKQYAKIHNIKFYVRVQQWICIEKGKDRWLAALDSIHGWIAEQIERQWDNENGQIIKAILLGDKGAMEDETIELFRKGGISHIIAISGLHFTILSEILTQVLKRLQKPKSAQLEVTGLLWVYVILTGSSVSTLRAAIMMSIRTAAVLLNREEEPLNTLALTAGILLIKQPLYILDAGFSLSFAALLGMRYGKIILMSVQCIPYRLRRFLSSSLGIAFATMPLSLWFFYEASVYGFILNFWVVPAMEILLMAVLAAMGLSMIHPAMGQGLACVADFLLLTFKKGSGLISLWPGAQLRGQPTLYQMMAIYGIWILLIIFYSYPYKKMERIKICAAGVVCWLLAGYRPSFWRIIYLDVGQGDCAVIEWNKKAFIVDAGPDYEDVLKPYLMMRGIEEIEGVVLSHSDWDHMEGLIALTQDREFAVKRLWISEEPIQIDENLIQLEDNVQNQGGSVLKVNAGYRFAAKGFGMEVLSPKVQHDDKNEGSLVVEFDVEGWNFLFSGDIGEATEAQLQMYWEDIDVLKVAHHGSKYSSTEDFLRSIEPEIAVISCGRNNRYRHPHTETLKRFQENEINYYVTADRGAIWIEEDNNQLIVQQYIVE